MSNCDCFGQTTKTYKNRVGGCFVDRGCSVAKTLLPGVVYESCSPLVQGETKHDPLQPMAAADECIVAWVGDCHIDATGWTEACKAHVYIPVKVVKQCVNWPCDEEGNQIFTVEDLEMIYQGADCCSKFIDQTECATAPAWVEEINAEGKKIAV